MVFNPKIVDLILKLLICSGSVVVVAVVVDVVLTFLVFRFQELGVFEHFKGKTRVLQFKSYSHYGKTPKNGHVQAWKREASGS